MSNDVTRAEHDRMVDAAVNGNERALIELIESYRPLIHWVLLQNDVFDPADRDDLCQDVSLSVFNELHKLRNRTQGGFRAWLVTVTRNAAIRGKKARRRQQEFEEKGQDLDLFAVEDRPALDFEARLDKSFAKIDLNAITGLVDELKDDRLRRSLRGLRPLYQEILILIEVLGFTPTEVSNLLGKKLGSIAGWRGQAKRQLRRLVKAQDASISFKRLEYFAKQAVNNERSAVINGTVTERA